MAFEEAVLTNFPLQTVVAALHVFLGMGKPGSASPEDKVLIWGAGGAVGQYGVQYARSVSFACHPQDDLSSGRLRLTTTRLVTQ